MFGKASDEALVAKALEGNAKAWDKLIIRYEGKIYNYGLRMTGNPDDAMDLMQEVFLSVYRNLGKYRRDAPFAAWIFRIASHRATDFFRRRKPVDPIGDEERFESGEDSDNPEWMLDRGENNRRIMALLDQLTPKQRAVVELKFFQEQTFEEMADILEVSTNTLKSRFYGALEKLKHLAEVTHAV
jgi:RNA polymerase sigma-70 factor (ECF subfamily)